MLGNYSGGDGRNDNRPILEMAVFAAPMVGDNSGGNGGDVNGRQVQR